jgi:hypothetical protein
MENSMLRLFVLAASILMVSLASASWPDDANLIKNPGFEDLVSGKPAIWGQGGFSEGGKGALASSTDKPHAGKQCGQIKGEAEWATFVSNRIPVKKDQTFELKGFVRVAKGNATIKFDYFKGNEYIGMTAADNTESTDWTELSVTSDISSFPEATHITCTLVGGGGEYEAYFDDIVLKEKK